MSPTDRYRSVAAAMTQRVNAVPADRWNSPAPCEGWVARDIIGHLVGWIPGLLGAGSGITMEIGPSADDDPAGAWMALDHALQTLLDDPQQAAATFSHPMAGTHRFADAVDMFVTNDVFFHTWDLARATGGDETLDADEVHALLVGMEPMDEMLRASGQYGPRVPVAPDADEQTRLIAFIGRNP